MKHGRPNSDTPKILRRIWNKLNVDGTLKKPLDAEEVCLVFTLQRYMEKEYGDGKKTKGR